MLFFFFSLYLNIRGLRKGPGKYFMGVLESPGFFVGKRVGTLRRLPPQALTREPEGFSRRPGQLRQNGKDVVKKDLRKMDIRTL